MLAAESYKIRLEKGLNFIEFNYMVLQAYDYFHLFQNYHCELQMGGNDQWGNMLAGTELIRKVTGKDAHALTFPLPELGHLLLFFRRPPQQAAQLRRLLSL